MNIVVGFEIQRAMTEIQQRSLSYTIHSHNISLRIDSTFLDCEVEIPGYDIVRSDQNRYGGGVAIYKDYHSIYPVA